MNVSSAEEHLRILRRGAVDVVPEAELLEKLRRGQPLRVKFGADPSSPDLHLGHYVVLRKLRELQELGHQIVFLIGDFTGTIGDPTGRSETRKQLGRDEVARNAETYREQVFRVLDRGATEVCSNSEWMDRMTAADLIRLCGNATVARMLEREDFSARYGSGHAIGIHEFLYPLIQAYDSVMVRADLEVGGSDQRFNLLMGREVQRAFGQSPQAVLMLPLLEGTGGGAKMSKSLGNAVGIDEAPTDMFGKLMSISDELMGRYMELLEPALWDAVGEGLKAGQVHPMEAKKRLAWSLVRRFHGDGAADQVQAEFEHRFQRRQAPTSVPAYHWPGDVPEVISVPELLFQAGLVGSKSEARRLISQGAVRIGGERQGEFEWRPSQAGEGRGVLVQVGSRRACEVFFKETSIQP